MGDRTRIPARSVTKTWPEARDAQRRGAQKQLMPSVLCKPHLFRNTLIFVTVSTMATNSAPNDFLSLANIFYKNQDFCHKAGRGVEFNTEQLCLT